MDENNDDEDYAADEFEDIENSIEYGDDFEIDNEGQNEGEDTTLGTIKTRIWWR